MSVIDYLLLNKDDINYVKYFNILEWDEFSDHRCLHFAFSRKRVKNNKNISSEETINKIFFDENKIPLFENLLQNKIAKLIENMSHSDCVENYVDFLTNFLEENAKAVFGKRVHVNCRYNPLPKWFNEACIIAKQNFNIARTEFSKQNTEDIKARNKYNNTRKRAKQKYMNRESMNLENIAKRDPRNFWKGIKRVHATSAKITNKEISIDQFYEHFKTLLSNHDYN